MSNARSLKKQTVKHQERGVTMVIAMVMLASVTFISFALSSIIIREIMAARLVLRSEPAISGANAGGEVGLYQLFRETGTVSATGALADSGVTYDVAADLYDAAYPFVVNTGVEARVALYDATNPDNLNANYGTVTIVNEAGSRPIRVEVYNWSNLEAPICQSSAIPASSPPYTCALNNIDDRYLVVIRLTGGSGSATGVIETTDNAGLVKGVPADFPELKVTGKSGGVQRRIQINFH